jgi:GDP-L-fucose synthase
MIRKFHEAKLGLPDEAGNPRELQAPVVLWVSGRPRWELHVDDLARAVRFLLQAVGVGDLTEGLLNVGTNEDVSTSELATLVQRAIGHRREITWDESKPDGTRRKLLDVSRLKGLGWQPEISLEEGIHIREPEQERVDSYRAA